MLERVPDIFPTHGIEHEFDVIVERDSEGYYVASVPALPGCHTQAKSLDDLMERAKEAIRLCLEVEGVIRYKHIGPLTPTALEQKLLPLIKNLSS